MALAPDSNRDRDPAEATSQQKTGDASPSTDHKKRKHKKKRISKHVLKALEDKKKMQEEQQEASLLAKPTNEKSLKSKKKQKKKEKDPSEAASYLQTWNDKRDEWKFNKNTQSWLIRHMYDSERVTKSTFAILLEYLKRGGDATTQRVRSDATHRALRYKEYEKNKDKEGEGDDSRKDGDDAPSSPADGGEDDETRWKKLNDHDKRKEYKRARKTLDALKES